MSSVLKRPHDQSGASVFVPPLAKRSKDSSDAELSTFSCEEMARRDLIIMHSLPSDDRKIFLNQLQWQRVLNMASFTKVDTLEQDDPICDLLYIELRTRGIGPIDKDWSWKLPLPLLPGYSSTDFPPFDSFVTNNISVDDECSLVVELCANHRKKVATSGVRGENSSSPKQDSAEAQTTYQTAPPLKLRSDTRCERERLLMDMASSRLFSLAFSTETSAGTSRYDIASDAILWSVDFTFHLDTKNGPKEETFVLDDTSERDTLKPNIDSVIYFDDVQDSITAEFEKATERSESCFNVFFVTPSVFGLSNEPQYYLVNAEDTLLEAIRGKLVVDRPRFLIVLKSQSMQFLRKKANPIPKQIQPTLPVGHSFPTPITFTPQPFNQPSPFVTAHPGLLPQPHQQLPMPFMQPAPAGMLMPGHPNFPHCPPNIMPAQPILGNPHAMQTIPTMGFPSVPQFPGPVVHPIVQPQAAVPIQPTPISRANLVVLTSNPVKTLSTKVISEANPVVVLPSNPVKTISTKVVNEAKPVESTNNAVKTTSTTVVSEANPVVSTSNPVKTISSKVVSEASPAPSTNNPAKTIAAKVVNEKVAAPTKAPAATVVQEVTMRPVNAQKGTGTKFTPVEMARRDSDKLKKYSWNVQKELLFKLPLNRAINLFYYLRKTGNKALNNVRSLLPHRFLHVGIDRIPPSWSITQPLPMIPGYAPLLGITPITEFEIDTEADDANFELVAKSHGITTTKTTPENKKENIKSAVKPVPSTSSSSTQSTTVESESSNLGKRVRLTPPEMALKDYGMLRKISGTLVREAVATLPTDRLVNLGYHLKKYPLSDKEKECSDRLKCVIFSKLHQLGVARLDGNWSLTDEIPALPGKSKSFGKVPSTFRTKRSLNNDQPNAFVWPGLPVRLKVEQDKSEEENEPTVTRRSDMPGSMTEEDQPKFVRDVEMLLSKARSKGVQMFISADAEGNQAPKCKCFYDPTTDSISWSLMITLEAVRNGKYQEEVFDIHGIYEKDSLQSILRNFVFDIANRRHSLADEFKPTIRDDNMKNVELSMMVPVISDNKMVQLKRTVADHTLSLADALKSKVVVDCPRFIARCKLDFTAVSAEEAVVKKVVEVDPPLLVRFESLTTGPPSSFKEAVKKTLEEDNSLKGKMEVAFTLTPNQVASNDRDILKTLPWEDQKLLVSLMPWDRVVALVLLLRGCKDENDAKNLLILCNLRLEKLGIGALPDDWKTSDKVPVLPGFCSSSFPPFSFFDMCEVPLVSRSLNDVKYLSEEVSSLRNDADSPRLLLRFEPR